MLQFSHFFSEKERKRTCGAATSAFDRSGLGIIQFGRNWISRRAFRLPDRIPIG